MKVCPQCSIKFPDALEICPSDGTELPPSASAARLVQDSHVGTTIDGRYLVESKLGEGGMGVVYAGRHVIIDKRVAIKVLKKQAQEEETAAQRFIQEAKSASKIDHPNIVDINDFGVLPDGSAYFVMEFLDGQSLGQILAQGPLPSRRVLSIAAEVARGLHAAHQKGIIHRDLKPDNIFLVESEGQAEAVKILDFGIAKVQAGPLGEAAQKLTQVGMVLGTPEYMSPEQATGKETDHRVDEYALGCIMYEMLTSEVPFKADTAAGVLTKHVFEPVIPPRKRRPDLAISPALELVVLHAMAKKPDERYASMRELLDGIDIAASELDREEAPERPTRPIATPTGSDAEPLAIPRKRNMVAFAVLGSFAAVGVIALAGFLLRGQDPPAPPLVSPAVEPSVATAPREVKFTLRSSPVGAEIFLGEEYLGRAPVQHVHAAGTMPLAFTFRLAGYLDASRELIPDENKDVEVPLTRRETKLLPVRPARPTPAKPPSGRPAPPVRPRAKGDGELRDPF